MGATPAADRPQGPDARRRCRPSSLGLTLAVVSLLGFSAMVGAVGGGGLGDLGIRYGYQRFMPDVMAAVVVVLIVLVQVVQSLGDRLARRLNKRSARPDPAVFQMPCLHRTGDLDDRPCVRTDPSHRPRRQPRRAAGFAACSRHSPRAQTVRIGVTPGPHAQILEAVKPIAAKKGLDLKIVEFSDYVVPNQALDGRRAGGELVPEPALSRQPEEGPRLQDRVSVGQTVNFPLGIYSKKHKSFDAVPDGGDASRSRTIRPMAAARCCCCRTRA